MADTKEEKPQYDGLSRSREMNWLNVLFLLQVYVSVVFAFHFLLFNCMWRTVFFSVALMLLGLTGQFAGSHRLWAHRSYEAKPELRIFLMLCQTLVGHGSIYEWVRWHRLHHKYFGTDLDPYNPKKGFWYAQVRCLTLKLSPAQEKALQDIDMSDIEADRIVMWQKKWYFLLFPIITLLLPINAPAEYWGEDLVSSVFIAGWLRYGLLLQLCWLIQSASRIWGLQPGEKFPADTNLVFIITKSYWLSYHYLAPWDYQTSEYGKYGTDCVSKFIRCCAALGYASNLRTISPKAVRNALTKSIVEKKDITQCLLESSDEDDLPPDHFLTPEKHY